MKRWALLIFALMVLWVLLLPVPPAPVAAQEDECALVDTVWLFGITGASAEPHTGDYILRAGHRYKIDVTGEWHSLLDDTHGDYHWYSTAPGWGGVFPDERPVHLKYAETNLTAHFSPPDATYQPDNHYSFEYFGGGEPLTVYGVRGSTMFDFTFYVCEYPLSYAIPSCTLVEYIELGWLGAETGTDGGVGVVPLVNDHVYDIYVAGQMYGGAPAHGVFDALYWSGSSAWVGQSYYQSVGPTGGTLADWSAGVSPPFESSHFYHFQGRGVGVPADFGIFGGWSNNYGGGFEIYICDMSITPTPSPTVSSTPTRTSTPIISPTWTATTRIRWLPTMDTRPVCTGTPRPTNTPFMLARASWTPFPTWTPRPTNTPDEGDDLLFGSSVEEPEDPDPTLEYWPTALPTATNTPRTAGDCLPPITSVGSGGTPIVDIGDTDLVREDCEAENPADCPVAQTCVTILPAVSVTISDEVQGIINGLVGYTLITDGDGQIISYPGARICIQRRRISIALLGEDYTGVISTLLAFVSVMWAISMVRSEI